MDIARQDIYLDVFDFFEILNLLKECFDANVFVVLIFKEFWLEVVELVLCEDVDIVHFFLI